MTLVNPHLQTGGAIHVRRVVLPQTRVATAIEAALKANMGMVKETIRTTMVPLANLPADVSVLGSEIFDIADGKIELTLKSSNVGVDDITVKLEAAGTN